MSQAESGRRILWIVGIYRAVCGAALLGTAMLLDLKVLGISTPNLFLTYATLYFIFGLATFWIVQRETLPVEPADARVGAARPATSSASRW